MRILNGAPSCAFCGLARKSVHCEPITGGYELQTLICQICETTVRMVCRQAVFAAELRAS
jgi:transcription elongation factor Elf1